MSAPDGEEEEGGNMKTPSEPGFYWAALKDTRGAPEVVRASEWSKGCLVVSSVMADDYSELDEWEWLSERLTPPEETP